MGTGTKGADREQSLWSPRDWWEDLVWPHVFASPLQGLRTWRVLMSFFAILIVVLIFGAGVSLDRAWKDRANQWDWAMTNPLDFADTWHYAVGLPKALVSTWPITTIVAGPIALVAWLIAMGALCRGSAVEMATGRRASWTTCLAFALRRWRSIVGSVALTWIAVWMVSLVIAAGGLLFRVPVLDVVAAIAYPLAILLGALAVLLILGYAVGHHLLIPAVVCDGADTIDAVQRMMAYVFGRPLRLILYFVLAMVSLFLIQLVATLVFEGALAFAARSATLFSGERGDRIITFALLDALTWNFSARGEEGSAGIASRIVQFWSSATLLLLVATLASCFASAITGVYLGVRRIADGQDMAEIYEPGQIEASMAETLDSRAKATGNVAAPAAAANAGDGDADYT